MLNSCRMKGHERKKCVCRLCNRQKVKKAIIRSSLHFQFFLFTRIVHSLLCLRASKSRLHRIEAVDFEYFICLCLLTKKGWKYALESLRNVEKKKQIFSDFELTSPSYFVPNVACLGMRTQQMESKRSRQETEWQRERGNAYENANERNSIKSEWNENCRVTQLFNYQHVVGIETSSMATELSAIRKLVFDKQQQKKREKTKNQIEKLKRTFSFFLSFRRFALDSSHHSCLSTLCAFSSL